MRNSNDDIGADNRRPVREFARYEEFILVHKKPSRLQVTGFEVQHQISLTVVTDILEGCSNWRHTRSAGVVVIVDFDGACADGRRIDAASEDANGYIALTVCLNAIGVAARADGGGMAV